MNHDQRMNIYNWFNQDKRSVLDVSKKFGIDISYAHEIIEYAEGVLNGNRDKEH